MCLIHVLNNYYKVIVVDNTYLFTKALDQIFFICNL